MIKSVLKEILIIILLIAAMILLLGILFYDYMPTSKVIPSKVQEYAMDPEIQKELEKELNNTNSEEVVKTYLLDATDLAAYERTREYNKGKQNPFSRVDTGSGNSSGSSGGSGGTTSGDSGDSGSSGGGSGDSGSGNGSSNNSNENGNTNTTTNTNTSSGGTYLNVVGK